MALGARPSIPGAVVLGEAAGRAGLDVAEGVFPLDRLLAADEGRVLPPGREGGPIGAVGDGALPVGDAGRRLAAAFRAIVAQETG